MVKGDLAKIIADKTSLKTSQAESLVSAFCSTIEEELAKQNKIIYSNFGTFYTVHYPSKVIYHPKLGTAKKMIMLPTNAVKWMPSGNIKALANSGIIAENITAHGSKRKEFIPKKENILEVETNIETNKKEDLPINNISVSDNKTLLHTADQKEEVSKKPVNIYEELMNDGSKVESTFKDVIRVHRDKTKSFLGKVFGRNTNGTVQDGAREGAVLANPNQPIENKDISVDKKVSPVGTGIFDKDATSIPVRHQQTEQKTPEITSIDAPKPSASPSPSVPKTDQKTNPYDFFPSQKNVEKDAEEKPITPFAQSKVTDISYIDLSKVTVSKETLQKLPEKLARKYKLVPVEENENEVTVAMVDPEDIEAKEIIKKYIPKKILFRLAAEEDINHVLDQYSGLESELAEAIETADETAQTEKNIEQTKELTELSSDNAPAARIVTSLLRRAIREKASDIHIEPAENQVEVRFRTDGVLQKKVSLPKNVQLAVVSRIKILSTMKIDEQRLPQDGRFGIDFENRKVDFRVSTLPTSNGEKVVMRILDKSNSILTIEQLGVRGQGLATLQKNIEKTHGMVLVTGPTGSGKTTTLYALIDKIYSEGINIVTLEDPIEYRMPGINQSQVNAEIDYTFASGLRTIVRQDPDVIMIGEIRDSETAEMAVHAALTGHVVLSTLHTNDSAGAIPRLIDMGVEPFLLTSSINCIIGQRLARKICEDCKQEIEVKEEEIKQIKEELQKLPEKERLEAEKKEIKLFQGKGCKNCGNSGYKGRIGVFEILDVTEQVKDMIIKKESSFEIEALAIKEGMVTMIQDGVLKAIDGITTYEEVLRVIKE